MAASTQERVHFFRTRLEELDCPYIDGVEDTWIEELIFKPGEPRIRLIQWLLGRFDPTVHDILESHQGKAKELLFVCSLLGLCKNDDIELLKGSTSKSKQIVFMENMIDLVSTVDSLDSSAKIHGKTVTESIADQFENDCKFLDTLCRQEDLSDVFKTRIQLCPLDLVKGDSKSDDSRVPDNKQLASVADQLASELEAQNMQLEDLRAKIDENNTDSSTREKVNKTLSLALTTMSQVVTSFIHCYETEMKSWCYRSQPKLSELGPAFQRVHSLLDKYSVLMESLCSVKLTYSSMRDTTGARLQKLKDHALVPMSKNLLERLSQSSAVLEESLQRYQES